MALQDDINAAVVAWATALGALKSAQGAVNTANAAVGVAWRAVRGAAQSALAGQSVDVIAIGAALKTANDNYTAALLAVPSLQDAADSATLALAGVIADPLGVTVDQVVSVLNDATQ